MDIMIETHLISGELVEHGEEDVIDVHTKAKSVFDLVPLATMASCA